MNDAASTYERVRAACCDETGLSHDDWEEHVRLVTMVVLRSRRQVVE